MTHRACGLHIRLANEYFCHNITLKQMILVNTLKYWSSSARLNVTAGYSQNLHHTSLCTHTHTVHTLLDVPQMQYALLHEDKSKPTYKAKWHTEETTIRHSQLQIHSLLAICSSSNAFNSTYIYRKFKLNAFSPLSILKHVRTTIPRHVVLMEVTSQRF